MSNLIGLAVFCGFSNTEIESTRELLDIRVHRHLNISVGGDSDYHFGPKSVTMSSECTCSDPHLVSEQRCDENTSDNDNNNNKKNDINKEKDEEEEEENEKEGVECSEREYHRNMQSAEDDIWLTSSFFLTVSENQVDELKAAISRKIYKDELPSNSLTLAADFKKGLYNNSNNNNVDSSVKSRSRYVWWRDAQTYTHILQHQLQQEHLRYAVESRSYNIRNNSHNR